MDISIAYDMTDGNVYKMGGGDEEVCVYAARDGDRLDRWRKKRKDYY